MRILIVGFGSIGRRHFEILSNLENVGAVDIVTKQNIQNQEGISYKNLCEVQELSHYDYFVIASETAKHHEQLKYICSKVSGKKILVEKPLFDKQQDVFDCNNKVFTAYNLRFHPVLEQLKRLIKGEEIYYVNAICGQYLPLWRPEQDYRQSYSADINQGGGVLRDLSHELDYLTWIFGGIDKIDSINTKVSDLDINSDDLFTAIAITQKGIILNLTIDYISKIPMRQLVVHTKNKTIELDITNNSLISYDKKANRTIVNIAKSDRNYTYTKMHQSIINNEFGTVCSFDEGKKVMDIIDSIEFKEL